MRDGCNSAFPDIQGNPHHCAEQPSAPGQKLELVLGYSDTGRSCLPIKNRTASPAGRSSSRLSGTTRSGTTRERPPAGQLAPPYWPGPKAGAPARPSPCFPPGFWPESFLCLFDPSCYLHIFDKFYVHHHSSTAKRTCQQILQSFLGDFGSVHPCSISLTGLHGLHDSALGVVSCKSRTRKAGSTQSKTPQGKIILEGFSFETPASTYFHRPCPANYLRHK